MLNLHVKIAKFGWGGMPPDPATTVWFVTFFNPYEFAGIIYIYIYIYICLF